MAFASSSEPRYAFRERMTLAMRCADRDGVHEFVVAVAFMYPAELLRTRKYLGICGTRQLPFMECIAPESGNCLDRLVACLLRWPEPRTSRNLDRPRIAGTQNRSRHWDDYPPRDQQDSLRWNEQALTLLARELLRDVATV